MKLNWVHLSDIHFNFLNYDTEKMRDQLIAYAQQLANETKYDVIFITGDICYKGADYAGTSQFMENVAGAFKVSKKNIFMVPGNHDLVRSQLRQTIIAGLKDGEASENFNRIDSEVMGHLLRGQEIFFNFYREFFGEDYPNSSLHFIKEYDLFNVIYMNTCIAAGVDHEEGALVVGQLQLYRTLKKLEDDTKLNIAIGHHGLDCFNSIEQSRIEHDFVDCNVDIYLCGHIHKPKYAFPSDDRRTVPIFNCGSLMVDGYSGSCFITGCFDLESKTGDIYYHAWSTDNAKWFQDSNVGRRLVNGRLNFNLERLQSAEPTAPVIDEDELKQFIVDFHSFIARKKKVELKFIKKDIAEKFVNMKCNEAIKTQYDKNSIYFPVINEIMQSASYLDFEKRMVIPNVIIEEYNLVYDSSSTGTQIIEKMVNSLYGQYQNQISYSKSKLKGYMKLLIYWCIHECDIFNDKK